MSIGYRAIKSAQGKGGVRELQEIKLFEFGPVDFAANDRATISAIKSLAYQVREGFELTPEVKKELRAIIDEIEPFAEPRDQPETLNPVVKKAFEDLLTFVKSMEGTWTK